MKNGFFVFALLPTYVYLSLRYIERRIQFALSFSLATFKDILEISTVARNQFVASQTALNVAFLPAFMLSGFLYEITSMPIVIQWITHLLPARYFVSILQSSFLAGTIWAQVIPNLLAMGCIAGFFLFLVVKKSVKRLD